MSGKKIKMKIEDWTIQVADGKMLLSHPNKKGRAVTLNRFMTKGMSSLPKDLSEKIKKDLRYANMYDKLIDKIYDGGFYV